MKPLKQFLQELAYACLITWAVCHAVGCVSMNQAIAYKAIAGGK